MGDMASDQTRIQVWDDLLEIARVSRYFDALRGRYVRWRNAVRAVLALSGIGAIASLVDLVSWAALPEVLVAVVGAVVVLDLIVDPATTVAKLTVVCTSMEKHEIAIRLLWQRIAAEDGTTDEAIQVAASEIMKAAHETASLVDIPTHPRLNARCADTAYKVEAHRYAS